MLPLLRLQAHLSIVGALAAALGGPLPAQILPSSGSRSSQSGGSVAPHFVCQSCGARNYNLKDDGRRDADGLPILWCSTCNKDRSQRPSTGAGAGYGPKPSPRRPQGRGGLVLPPSYPPERGDPEKALPPRPAAEVFPKPPPRESAPREGAPRENTGAAAFVLAELKKTKKVDAGLVDRAAQSLLALGDEGLAAAREGLASDDAPVLLASARALLASKSPADADLVFGRFSSALPSAAGTPLVELCAAADPVRATPAFLAGLLEHPHTGVRTAAQKRLASLPSEDLLAVLPAPLASKRSDARCRAVELASGVDGPDATTLLFERLADPSAAVAGAVVDALATRPSLEGEDIDAKLVGLAFRDRWILRPGACALIAIVEREDRILRPILDETRVEALQVGLQSQDHFLSGACAAALSGIGFRSRDAAATAWLDQDVVDRLVAAVSGRVFHSDLPVLSSPALRRLELLSGQGIGADGPRWVEWWVQAREGFLARRAWLEVRPEDVPRISVRYTQAVPEPRDFRLLAPDAQADDAGPAAFGPEVFRLTDAEARSLASTLENEGVFGPTRLPGIRGLRGGNERTLEVSIGRSGPGARGKLFVYGPGESEDWFERTAALAVDLRDRARWQLYPDPARHATPLELWREQSAWWSEEHTELERALRLKALVLAGLPTAVGPKRLGAIGEIERIYLSGAAEPQDFRVLQRALAVEAYWAEPSKRLLALALQAASSKTITSEPGVAETGNAGVRGGELGEGAGRALVDLLVEKLSGAPREELAHVFATSGSAFAILMSSDPRPVVRAAAATALAETEAAASPSAEAVSTLLRLLGDRDPSVESAAASALGALRVEAARTELIVRARLGLPEVRTAALRAIGRLRGELVLDALSLAAADKDPTVRAAAADGLADLGDPAGATLLVGMLGEGDAPTSEAARRGLFALGPSAHDELLRVVHAPTHRARRDAALLLARQRVPEAASPMIAMLTSDPRDEHLASELAVLTGVDLRAETDPPGAWWAWWDGVVHDDALAWLLGALSRAGSSPPPAAGFAGEGTAEARLFLVDVLARREPHFVERARRELGDRLGRDLGPLPPRGPDRDRWIDALRQSVASTEAQGSAQEPAGPK